MSISSCLGFLFNYLCIRRLYAFNILILRMYILILTLWRMNDHVITYTCLGKRYFFGVLVLSSICENISCLYFFQFSTSPPWLWAFRSTIPRRQWTILWTSIHKRCQAQATANNVLWSWTSLTEQNSQKSNQTLKWGRTHNVGAWHPAFGHRSSIRHYGHLL